MLHKDEEASGWLLKPAISRFPALVLGLLVAFLLYVFLFAPITVTLDGYSHLYGAHVLREMWRGQPDFRAQFSYNSFLVPNWLATLTLAFLETIVSDELALKLLVVFTAVGLLCSLYYCADARRYPTHQRAQILILLLPFAANGYLILGFYGFLISSALCLFSLGVILRHGLHGRQQVGIACMLLIAYFFHPFPVLLSFVFLCSFLISLLGPASGWRGAASVLRQNLVAAWPWVIPLGMTLWFSMQLSSTGSPSAYSLVGTIRNRITALIAPDATLVLSPTPSAGALFIALLGVLAAMALLPTRKPSPEIGLRFRSLAIFLLFTSVIYFLVPDAFGEGGGIADRVLLYSAFGLVLAALVRGSFDARPMLLASLLATVLTLSLGFEYLLVSRRLSPAMAELRSATETLPSSSRVLNFAYRMTPACKGWPLLEKTFPDWHWAMSSAAARNLIVLNDYESNTTHFPLRYRDLRFAAVINGFDPASAKQSAAWTEALSRNDPDVEFVISWGVPSGLISCPGAVEPPFEQTLRSHFDLILAKEGRSRVTVWRKRK